MVPRPDIISMPINISLTDLLKFIREDGHSRFPSMTAAWIKSWAFSTSGDVLIKLDDIQQSYDLFKLLRPPFFVPKPKA